MTGKVPFYKTIILTILGGYTWLMFSILYTGNRLLFTGCLIKLITGIPCPSCGITRSIILLINGDFFEALALNPLSIIVAVIMALIPPLVIYDFLGSKLRLFNLYSAIEAKLANRKLAVLLYGLVFLNWIWNLQKGL
jgi:hypothetical protein